MGKKWWLIGQQHLGTSHRSSCEGQHNDIFRTIILFKFSLADFVQLWQSIELWTWDSVGVSDRKSTREPSFFYHFGVRLFRKRFELSHFSFLLLSILIPKIFSCQLISEQEFFTKRTKDKRKSWETKEAWYAWKDWFSNHLIRWGQFDSMTSVFLCKSIRSYERDRS